MTKKKIKGGKKKMESPALTEKKRKVDEIAKNSEKYPVVALLNLRNLPDRIFQASKKKLRGKAEFVVAKSTVIKRALEKTKKWAGVAEKVDFPTALVFTSVSPYELFKFFRENKSKVAAKPGQIAPFDIIIHPQDTDLPPGPALSELKSAGINAQIKGGKIIVAKDSVVALQGAKISDMGCKALQKLNILPFEAMVNMAIAHDGALEFTSDILDMDPARLCTDFTACLAQAFNVSFNSSFPTSQNIEALLANAFSQGRNVAVNGMVYSEASTELLLANAYFLGESLSGTVGPLESAGEPEKNEAAKKDEEKPEGKKEEAVEGKASEASGKGGNAEQNPAEEKK